ncbi:MAG: DNA polymerase III subunit beta [Bacteroidales bacterium]
MKFTVSNSDLLVRLQSAQRVISSRNPLPILDNFLFTLKDGRLQITASDMESSLQTSLPIENIEEEGEITVPAKLLADSLREFPDIPLEFKTNSENSSLEIVWANGNSTLPCTLGEEYPQPTAISSDSASFSVDAQILLEGINRTLYATADDELRPVLNGIFFDIEEEKVTMVATDAHKLVCYTRNDISSNKSSSFILPKKPSAILKSLLPKIEGELTITFDESNAHFQFDSYLLSCRLVEGNYPAYRSVIPKENNNKLTINRQDLLNSLRRVAIYSNQASNLVKLELSENHLTLSAQDIDFSISSNERVNCQYDGEPMVIGFKSTFLIDILTNLPFTDLSFELSDPSRAALLLPAEKGDSSEEILALIIPLMIGA